MFSFLEWTVRWINVLGQSVVVVRNFSQTFTGAVERWPSQVYFNHWAKRAILRLPSDLEAVVSLFFVITYQLYRMCFGVCIGQTGLNLCEAGAQGKQACLGSQCRIWGKCWSGRHTSLQPFLSLGLNLCTAVHSVCVHSFVYSSPYCIPGPGLCACPHRTGSVGKTDIHQAVT